MNENARKMASETFESTFAYPVTHAETGFWPLYLEVFDNDFEMSESDATRRVTKQWLEDFMFESFACGVDVALSKVEDNTHDLEVAEKNANRLEGKLIQSKAELLKESLQSILRQVESDIEAGKKLQAV